jgi:hypothetical protein
MCVSFIHVVQWKTTLKFENGMHNATINSKETILFYELYLVRKLETNLIGNQLKCKNSVIESF